MLKLLRHKNVAKIVLWAILILILPAFVIWGTGNLGRSKEKGPTYVGVINNKKVSFDDFAGSLADIRCQIILNYFNQAQMIDLFLKNKPLMGKLAWDGVILSREVKRLGIKVSDKEVVGYIRKHPLFLRNGAFDDMIYQYVLRNNMGIDPRGFEEMVRANLATKKLYDIMTKDIKITDAEVLEEYKKEVAKFKISYVLIELEQAKDKAASLPDMVKKENLSFEKACDKLGLKVRETPLFSRSDYLEGIGEASNIADEIVKLQPQEISAPIDTRKGVLICKVIDIQGFDEERFKAEKEVYAKKALEDKKNKFLEARLKKLESASALKIDLKEYDKYYR